MAAVAFSMFLSVGPAHADALSDCQQQLLSGQIDLNGYLACLAAINSTTSSSVNTGSGNNNNNRNVVPVSSSTTSGSLPTTGSNSGRFVGIGAALIVLGGAALYGATRNRRENETVTEAPSEE